MTPSLLRRPAAPTARVRWCVALAFATGLSACTDDDDDDTLPAFAQRNTSHAVAASTPILGSGEWLVFFADEATTGNGGRDLNGDSDLSDSVVIRVDTRTGSARSLSVDAEAAAWCNGTLFIETLEANDGRDWNGDSDQTDRVLLFARNGDITPTFFAELASGSGQSWTAVRDTVVYASTTAATAEFETNLAFARVTPPGAAPSAAQAIVSTIDDPNDDGLTVRIARAVGDVVFCTLDETADGNLNGDGDATDTAILALLDVGETTPTLLGTGRALSSATATAAVAVGSGDWLGAFLVDEAAQSANLNDPTLFVPTWQPPNCSGRADADQLDHVLHWFRLSDFVANARIVNTGLVGAQAGPVLAHSSAFVGVVSNEASEGNGGCDLNGDADFTDNIFRWVAASDPTANVLPVTDSARLLAVAAGLPGGSGGFVSVGNVIAIAVDEDADGRDHDGAPTVDRILIAAHAPATSGQAWNFQHGSGTTTPIGVTWMAADARSTSRFLAAITEENLGDDRNGDGDTLDSLPTFPVVLTANRLGFPGVGVAVVANNAGIATAGAFAFYRVSESADGNRDRNNDGDTNDQVLQRILLTGGQAPVFMGSLNNVTTPALGTGLDGVKFAAHLYQESLFGPSGNDLNGDGDALDFVVRYYRVVD